MSVQSIPVVLMFGIAVYAGLSRLMMYFRLKENRENLFFALVCFAVAFYDTMCIGLYNVRSVAAGIGWQKGQFFAGGVLMIFILVFVGSVTRTRVPWIRPLFAGALLLLMAAGALFPGRIFDAGRPSIRKISVLNLDMTYTEAHPGLLMNILIALTVLAAVYVFTLLFLALFRDKRRDLIPLIAGFLTFAASTLLDGAIANNALAFVYTTEYSFLLLILMMDFTVQKRFAGLYREVEGMNVTLEARVAERTADIRQLSEELAAANRDLEDKNRVLGELVERDSLTRLLNHAAFHSRLAEIFNESRRHRFSFAVVMMDLDHFKKINDACGHPVGDRVLKEVARVLMQTSRNYDVKARVEETAEPAAAPMGEFDVAGRYGGDEFAVILPFASVRETKIAAERIVRAIAEMKVDGCPGLRVSVSLGGVVFDPRTAECDSERRLIALADRALYAAKTSGRNQAVIEKYGA